MFMYKYQRQHFMSGLFPLKKLLHHSIFMHLNTRITQCIKAQSVPYTTIASHLKDIDYSVLPPLSCSRNFGISAHVDSGKTTLTERILFYTGRISKIHEIQGADGVGAKMDSMELEREKGITIQSAATFVRWKFNNDLYHFNIIDTPGHVDFQMEVERSLRILDGAVLVVCSVNGVQPQTYTVDRQMKRYHVPRFIFINKLDRANSNPTGAIASLRSKLRLRVAPIHIPIGLGKDFSGIINVIDEKAFEYTGVYGEYRTEIPIAESMKSDVQRVRTELIETLAEIDDELEEIYVNNGIVGCSAIHINKAIKRALSTQQFAPILMGSAKRNKGIQDVLDAVCLYLPPAGDIETTGFRLNDPNHSVTIKTNPKLKVVAMVFKIQEHAILGLLTYIKLYQGTLRKGIPVIDVSTGKKIIWKKMFRMHSDEAKEIPFARAGDIITLTGLNVHSGVSLVEEPGDITLTHMHVPDPVISVAATIEKGTDCNHFTKALKRFQKEDPTFIVHVDQESNEYIFSGMGELHLDIYKERMKREYGIKIETKNPKVNLREVIRKKIYFDYTHKRQTGGRGEWAKISGYFEPINTSGLTLAQPEFSPALLSSALPPYFIASIRKGFFEVVAKGPLSGHPVLNIRLVIQDGETHEADSSDVAFKNCIKACFSKYFLKAEPLLLEPLMKLEIVIPDMYTNDVQVYLSRNGINIIESLLEGEAHRIIFGEAPLRIMFGFIPILRQLTKGQGEFSMEFDRYVPADCV